MRFAGKRGAKPDFHEMQMLRVLSWGTLQMQMKNTSMPTPSVE